MKRLTRKTAFQLESLESRRLFSTLTVTSAADSGVGSLRAQIAAAQSGDSINFDPGLAGQTILLTSSGIAITKSLTIQGLGANQLTIRGISVGRSFDITDSTTQVAIRDLTLTDPFGGAIFNAATLTVSGCTLSGNSTRYFYFTEWQGDDGGAIYNTGTLIVSNSTFSGNDANNDSYGVSSGAGGAIFNAGTLTVTDSTFFGNTAYIRYPYFGAGGGGAIYNYYGTATISGCTLSGNSAYVGGGAIYINSGAVTVSNCTIANNLVIGLEHIIYDDDGNPFFVADDACGGGLFVGAGSTLSIDHSTLAGNDTDGARNGGATTYGGAIYGNTIYGGTIQLYDTIIADNNAFNGPDVYVSGSVTSLGHNLIGNWNGVSGFVASDLLNVNPQLAPTMQLLAGSPAINAGDNANAPAYDQRGVGFPRIVGGTIDIGAFEYNDIAGFTINDVSVTEGNTGSVNAVLTVTLSAPLTSTVTVDFATSNGSATIPGGDYLATSGTLTFDPGQTSNTISIPVNGDRIVEADEKFYVDLSGASNALVFDKQGVVTIFDDEPRVSVGNASVTEGDSGTTPMTFTVTLSAPYDVATSVNFNTASGSAIAGTDFDATSGTVTFQPGQTSTPLSVAVRGDVIAEYDESFSVALSGATNAQVVGGPGTGTIIDNDVPAIVVSDIRRAEGNAGTTPFTFTISLLTPSEKSVSVGYATANGTATSSTVGNKQDYLPASNTVTISPGRQSATVTVAVIGDTRNESDENFFLNLSNASNATIADAQGIGTILNDEGGRGKNWVGSLSGGSWGTAANWSPSGVPVSDSLVLISGAAVTLSASVSVAELDISGASLTLAAAGNRVLRTPGLYLEGNSKLNLSDNALIVDDTGASSLPAIQSALQSGYANGAWQGDGINSAVAASTAGRALGYVLASDVFGTFPATFQGQSVDASDVVIRYTLSGDANLDGQVNSVDFTSIAMNFNQSDKRWSQGDFNYDGRVNALDFNALASNYGSSLAAGSAAPAELSSEPISAESAAAAPPGTLFGRDRIERVEQVEVDDSFI